MKDHFTIIPNADWQMELIRPTQFVKYRFHKVTLEDGMREQQLLVSIESGQEKRVQFLLPCYFDKSWRTIADYAKYVDMAIKTGRPHTDNTPSRSISTKYIALTNGHVYQVVENWQYSCGYAYKCLLVIDQADMNVVLASLEKETA